MFSWKKLFAIGMATVLCFCMGMTGSATEEASSFYAEDFEKWTDALPTGWTLVTGVASNVAIAADAHSGTKSVKLTGTSETDVVQIRTRVPSVTGCESYELSAYLKVLEHVAGTGAKIYCTRSESLTSNVYGTAGYFTASSESFKKAACRVSYKYGAGVAQDTFLTLEYKGEGSVVFDTINMRHLAADGLAVNGDFDALSDDTNPGGWTLSGSATLEQDSETGNRFIRTTNSTSSMATGHYGMPVNPGESYRISFSFKTDAMGSMPYVMLYFSETIGIVGSKTLATDVYASTGYDVPTHTGWTEYTKSFVMPSDTTYTYLSGICVRGKGGDVCYYDNVRLLPDETDVSFLTTNNEAVAFFPYGKTLRARCYFVSPGATPENPVSALLINAIYMVDGNNVKTLVDIHSTGTQVTEARSFISADITLPEDDENTYIAEAFVWNSLGSVSPYKEKTVLH